MSLLPSIELYFLKSLFSSVSSFWIMLFFYYGITVVWHVFYEPSTFHCDPAFVPRTSSSCVSTKTWLMTVFYVIASSHAQLCGTLFQIMKVFMVLRPLSFWRMSTSSTAVLGSERSRFLQKSFDFWDTSFDWLYGRSFITEKFITCQNQHWTRTMQIIATYTQ